MPGSLEDLSSWIAEGRVGVAQGERSGEEGVVVSVEDVGESEPVSSGIVVVRGR